MKTKAIKKDKEGYYIMIKGSTKEEDLTLVNIYASNIGAPKHIKQILTNINGEIEGNTIIVGDFMSVSIYVFWCSCIRCIYVEECKILFLY